MTKKKKRAKHGRLRIQGCVREPNGRISRAKTPREPVDQLAIEIRAKRFCLTIQDAKNPLAGTYIGRLYLQGELNQDQYDAAQKRWIEKATDCYEKMKEVIKEAQYLYRQHNFYATLQYLVIEDQSLPYLVNSLRIVLNALHKHFSR